MYILNFTKIAYTEKKCDQVSMNSNDRTLILVINGIFVKTHLLSSV